jgi:DNA repair exonuclease SbcCD ATPase subunit
MNESVTVTLTPADQIKELRAEADAITTQQAAAVADAQAMQQAFDDVDREIKSYIPEYDKLASDTSASHEKLKAIVDRTKQRSGKLVDRVEEIISGYNKTISDKAEAYQKAKTTAADAEQEMRRAQADAAQQQAEFDEKKTLRDALKAQLTQLGKAATDAEENENAKAYAEAYAMARIPLDAMVTPPAVKAFADQLRTAWSDLNAKKTTLRQRADASVKAARACDDLKATIDELKTKKVENMMAQVKEALANGDDSPKTSS